MSTPSAMIGFEDQTKIPHDVKEEMESGRMSELAEKIGDFMRDVDGADECYFIVERKHTAIQYQVTLRSNGDIAVEITTVPKKDRTAVVEPIKRGMILP